MQLKLLEVKKMSLSTFRSKIKLLFDENVDKRLERFLKHKEVDVISKPKGFSDDKLAEISKLEQRILITNDDDFTKFPKERLFSVIWLRILQNKLELLMTAFSKLLKETKTFVTGTETKSLYSRVLCVLCEE